MTDDARAGPPLSAPAELVRRLDPDLFHAAIFAPEPARERLMVLAAFDIELSRATARASGPAEKSMLAAMRLQFWRDRVAAALEGGAPAAHEVAEPLHALLTGPLEPVALDALRLVGARDLELQTPLDEARFRAWVEMRFVSAHRLCLAALGLSERPGAVEAAASAGTAAAHAFAIRHSVALAAEGRSMVPGVAGPALTRLARGDVTPDAAETIKRLSREGLEALDRLRQARPALGRAAAPAFLPLWRAERDLRDAAGGLPGGGRPMPAQPGQTGQGARAVAYLWRAVTGRW
ncbi:MAG: squalene/phytoene synthase family protein [Pseudomonadota bacterium]